jgi:hypothetical protein
MQLNDLVTTAGGPGPLVTILAISVVGALFVSLACLVVTARANGAAA